MMNTVQPIATFRTGVAVTRGVMGLSCAMDALDPDEPYTRVMIYHEGYSSLWRYHEEDSVVSSLAISRKSGDGLRYFVALSDEGDVTLMYPEFEREKISGAGLHDPDAVGWGYMSDIQEIGDHLYACGYSGQVYRRDGPNNWVHMDDGLLQSPDIQGGEYSAQVINGPHEDAIYLAGCENLRGYPARADFWNGQSWRRLDLPKRAGRITNLFVESEERIWMCGANGTLLFGNASDGFRLLSSHQETQSLLSVTMLGGQIYLGSNRGLYSCDPKTPEADMKRVRTGLKPELQDANIVEAVDDVLWSIGSKDIARFDGKNWKRIDYPDNPRIGKT